uniref:BHLH domain-containing protein n=1 Tax=Opuntia streptacantha TaxID=393608 RepID=A0A7C8ZVE9_OPUST
MASMMPNFEDNTDRSRDSKPKKRRRIETVNQDQSSNSIDNNQNQLRWRSPAEQHAYSSKLLEAIRQVRSRNPSPEASSSRRAVREAADKVLAIAARGRTRWSRAILANRLKLRLKGHKKAKLRSKVPAKGGSRLRSPAIGDRQQRLPPLEKRVKVLSRLVPGCGKLPFTNLLEETTDYVAALQMQVRAMAALANLLTGSTAGSSFQMESSSRNS